VINAVRPVRVAPRNSRAVVVTVHIIGYWRMEGVCVWVGIIVRDRWFARNVIRLV
jgi:hypothetical protein